MQDREPGFFDYYARELELLRTRGHELSQSYKQYGTLVGLDPGAPRDPHVERILDGFAFMAAGIHEKLDSSFPEIAAAILDIISPGLLSPRPSKTVVELVLNEKVSLPAEGVPIPAGKRLHAVSRSSTSNTRFRFRTCSGSRIWPIRIESIEWNPPSSIVNGRRCHILSIELGTVGDVRFADLKGLQPVRFFLNPAASVIVANTLYELLFNNCDDIQVQLDGPGGAQCIGVLGSRSLSPVGFEKNDITLSDEHCLFWGGHLIREYFEFPEQFLFFDMDLSEIPILCRKVPAKKITLRFVLSDVEREDRLGHVQRRLPLGSVRLGCVPVVNMYTATSEPILLDDKRYEYPVIVPRRYGANAEILSIERVVRRNAISGAERDCYPLLSPLAPSNSAGETFWSITRRSSVIAHASESKVFISFLDRSRRPSMEDGTADTLSVWCSCSDGNLPFEHGVNEFDTDGLPQIASATSIIPVKPPTPARVAEADIRRLVANCSANYLSISEGGLSALKSILSVYHSSGLSSAQRQIESLLNVASGLSLRPIRVGKKTVLARGTRVRISLAEQNFDEVGACLYLFASVLERFLGMYTSLNSFTELELRSDRRSRPLASNSPRSGWKLLV